MDFVFSSQLVRLQLENHTVSAVTVLSGLSSYHRLQFHIPISPQTFTAVIYHFPVLSTCSLSLCWKKPSLWFVPSLLLLLIIASSSYSFFSSFSQAVDCIPLSPQSNVSQCQTFTFRQQRMSNISQRLKLMLLLYSWIIREYIKRKKYRLHTMI